MDLEDLEDTIEYTCDDIVEQNYLDPLYDTQSRLSHGAWIDASRAKKSISEVFYKAQGLRMLVFTRGAVHVNKDEAAQFKSFCDDNKVALSARDQ